MAEPKLNKRGGRVDFVLLMVIITLLLFGLVMLFSASSPRALKDGDIYSVIRKQAVISLIGCIGMAFTTKFDYHRYRHLSKPVLLVTIVTMYVVPLIGFASHGATRQISLGPVSFQPSELAKFVIVVYLASRFSNPKTSDIRHNTSNLMMPVLVLLIFVGGCALQSHMSAAVVIAGISLMMMIVCGLPPKYLYAGAAAGVALFGFMSLKSYRLDRFRALINPFEYRRGIGWQIIQSLYAVGSGGLFGLGLGQSRQKYLYLPEAHNDYIYAVICEELGFLGAMAVILLFTFFIWRGIDIALKAKDKFGMLLAFGITSIIGVQMLINIGVVLSVLPSTGMQLPFFSSGGTSMIVMLSGMGILLNISKSSKIKKM